MARGKRNKPEDPLVYNSLDELLALLEKERQKTLKRRRFAKVVLSIYLGFVILILIDGIMTSFHGFGGMGGMIGGLSGMIASMYAATNTQKKGVQALAEFDDLRAAPRLIEMLEYNDKDLKMDAASLLENLLPKLRASDAPMLTSEHHAILNRLLAGKVVLAGKDKALALTSTAQLLTVILTALQQVGTESSLPVVTELAEGKGRAKQFPQMQKAARECLPFLQSRVENQRQTQTLLRASDGNQTSTDVLLRPVLTAPSTTSADELLRAAPETDTSPALLTATVPVISQTLHVEPELEQEPQIEHLS